MGFTWERMVRPVLFGLDAERAHEIGIEAMRMGLSTMMAPPPHDDPKFGEIERFGLKFRNPLGIAAGFDKNGVVVNQLAALGFGFVEAGTVTYEPQPGNPKPRLFRLPEDQALINRLGFNNDGAAVVAERLSRPKRDCLVGVNIGRNKDVPNDQAIENYLKCFDLVRPVADYIAINVSSPNTPHLRDLQKAESLEDLVGEIQKRNAAGTAETGTQSKGQVPLLVKISPDLSEAEIESIVDVSIRNGIVGIIATNTTTSREDLVSKNFSQIGDGGLSGRPLAKRASAVVELLYRYSKGQLVVIGVGGIFTADDAFERIAAGASLIQAYTGFVYGGPGFPREILNGLTQILKDRGFNSIDEAVGSGAR